MTDQLKGSTQQLEDLLLTCPETGEDQYIAKVEGGRTLTIITEGETTAWRHRIKTDEVSLHRKDGKVIVLDWSTRAKGNSTLDEWASSLVNYVRQFSGHTTMDDLEIMKGSYVENYEMGDTPKEAFNHSMSYVTEDEIQ